MTRAKAKVARNKGPLGFGLRSVPEPLQRLWLIYQGNPFFEDDAKNSRLKLGIPAAGFQESSIYIDAVATRWKRHGHDDSLGQGWDSLILEGVPLRDSENIFRFTHKDFQLPSMVTAPIPCCISDPLFYEARLLARKYGIDEAEAEPGFEAIVEDVAGYLLRPAWPQRGSFRGHETIYEKNIIEPSTGERQREHYLRRELGIESRSGKGGKLPMYYEWWRQEQRDKGIPEITSGSTETYRVTYEERTVRYGIKKVERLMRPVGDEKVNPP